MSRDSRFDKLETPRTQRKEDGAPARLERFGAEEARPAEATPAPAPPGEGTHRFAEDGASGVHLDRDALAKLPFRRCPACNRDSSKWDTACIFCRTSLESPEAIAFNLQLLSAHEAERSAEQEAVAQARRDQVTAIANEQAEAILDEERRRVREETTSRRFGAAAVGLVCFSVMWVAPWYTLKLFAFIGFVLAASIAVPPQVWRNLAQSARGGWRG